MAGSVLRKQSFHGFGVVSQITGMAGCRGLVEGVSSYVSAVTSSLVATRQTVAALHQDIQHDWTVFTTCLDLIHTAGRRYTLVRRVLQCA